LYLLGWNYEKWKYILPFNQLPAAARKSAESDFEIQENAGFSEHGMLFPYVRFSNFLKQLFRDKFPFLFFTGVFAAMVICVVIIPKLYSVKPRNTFTICMRQFKDTGRTQAGEGFCSCVHNNGEPLNKCLNDYNNAPDDAAAAP
jgi:hypothetical protein